MIGRRYCEKLAAAGPDRCEPLDLSTTASRYAYRVGAVSPALASLALATVAVTQDADVTAWLDSTALTGPWFGLRERLEDRGATFALTLITDTSWPFSGGIDDRVTTRALFDAAVEVDLERALGWTGTRTYADFYSQAGRNGSVDVGDIQSFSNIDEANVAQLAELWVEHTTAHGDVRIKVGKVDASTEFAYPEAGLPLLHSSAGFSPTIAFLPTDPHPAVGLNVFVTPADGWTFGKRASSRSTWRSRTTSARQSRAWRSASTTTATS
jgi:carbohydrate-selective porin OprB